MKRILLFCLLGCVGYQAKDKLIDSQATKTAESAKVSMNDPKDDPENLKKIHSMFNIYKLTFNSVTNLPPKKVVAIKDVVYVDVRDDNERSVSMIKNALTKKEFLASSDKFKDKTVVAYCTIGFRSGLFTKDLLKKGFDAYNMLGGLLLWSHENYEVYSGPKKTNKIHVYGATWDLLKSGYVSVY